MATKGPLTKSEIDKIVRLLTTTEMSITEIAVRMGRARSAILNINRLHAVRFYAGRRTRWTHYDAQQPSPADQCRS